MLGHSQDPTKLPDLCSCSGDTMVWRLMILSVQRLLLTAYIQHLAACGPCWVPSY